jgi:hypothetical protein
MNRTCWAARARRAIVLLAATVLPLAVAGVTLVLAPAAQATTTGTARSGPAVPARTDAGRAAAPIRWHTAIIATPSRGQYSGICEDKFQYAESSETA